MSLYSALTQVLAPFAAKIKGIQTGYDGTEYENPGEAVREQINDLHVLIGHVPGQAIQASAVAYNDSNVAAELTNVNGRLREQQDISSLSINDCYINGTYIGANGSVGISQNYKRSGFIKVRQNDTIHYVLTGGASIALIAFFTDSDLSTYQQSNSLIGDGTVKTGDYVAPSDGYIIVSLNKTITNSDILFSGPTNHGVNHIMTSYTSYVGTSGNRPEIKVAASGTGLIVSVPNRLLIVGRWKTTYVIDFSEAQEITVPHNSFLVVDITNKALKTATYAELASVDYEYIILVYANNGLCLGQWSRYFYNGQATNDRRLIKGVASWVGTSGNRPEIKIVKDGTGITIYVPNRLLYIYDGTVRTYDAVATVYHLAHNEVLYFDVDNSTLATISVSNLSTLIGNYIILAYANNGRCLGQWRQYQIDSLMLQCNFPTIEFCNRQGETDGCPENSLIGAKTAKESGYDRVRISVQVTSDGTPVCYHDANLGGGKVYKDGAVVTDTSLKIHDMTYTILRGYDFGAYKGEDFTGTEIATLEEHIIQSKLMGYALDVEIKENVTALTSAELETIFDLVAKYGLINTTNYRMYNLETASLYTGITPKANVGIIATAAAVDLNALGALNTGQNRVFWDIYANDSQNVTGTQLITARRKNIRLVTGASSGSAILTISTKFDIVESSLAFPIQYLS